ncbi:MAG TPA: HD-GYP domain-containing protein [Terriglobales bacterium]
MSEVERLKKRIEELENENRRLNREFECSYDITLELLGDALDLKEGQTDAHSRRVTAFAIVIARAMGIPPDSQAMRVLARGAFLHDIGKMAIPDAILRKPEALTPDESAIMRRHPYSGYEMLKMIPFLQEAAEIVYAHHENFDGSGYPRGLRGEEIPFGARITAIANTFDAITSNLPYRPASSFQAARKEIEAGSGRQFDPDVVKVFLAMSPSIWEDLRKQINKRAKL